MQLSFIRKTNKFLARLITLFGLIFNVFINSFLCVSDDKKIWVENTLDNLSAKEKIGQMIFLSIDDQTDFVQNIVIRDLTQKYKLGGIIFSDLSSESLSIIKDTKNLSPSPIIGFKIGDNLALNNDLPIANLNQLASIRNRELLANYGLYVGKVLDSLGVDLVIKDPSKFKKTFSDRAIQSFLAGLSESGISHSGFYQTDESKTVLQFEPLEKYFNELPLKEMSFNKRFYKTYISKNPSLLHFSAANYADPLSTLKSGGDFMLIDRITSQGISKYIDAIDSNLKRKQIEYSAKKIIQAKAYFKASNDYLKSIKSLRHNFFGATYENFRYDILEHSIVLAKNNNNLLPVKNLDLKYIATISRPGDSTFRELINKYGYANHYNFGDLPESLANYDLVIINNFSSQSLQEERLNKITVLTGDATNTILLTHHDLELSYDEFDAVVWTHEYSEIAIKLFPQIIFGGHIVNGQLPYDLDAFLKTGDGFSIHKRTRISYAPLRPNHKIDYKRLNEIDDIIKEAIDEGATPGCQVMAIKDGEVIFDKVYGHFTYDKVHPVKSNTLYDLASLTKVFATTQTLMFLVDQNRMDLNKPLKYYMPELEGTNKADLVIKDILAHQAGLKSFIPLWKETFGGDGLGGITFNAHEQNGYDKVYIPSQDFNREALKDTVWSLVVKSDLRYLPGWKKSYNYRYSDIGFIILKVLAERILNQPIEDFLSQHIFDRLGADHIQYKPLCNYDLKQIAPTEYDYHFRKTQIWGTVHDQNAAILGEVAGHAGLFADANSLAKNLQMILSYGQYGGESYFHPEVVYKFTKKAFRHNRRALGWDKPRRYNRKVVSKYATMNSFGHTGFTGTMIWADPDYDLCYIFLSNRIYPEVKNIKLHEKKIRTRVQDIIYESILSDS